MTKSGLAVSLALVLGSSSAFAADVRIGTEGAYAPWNFMADDGKVAGFEIELGNNLCERAGLSCEWVVNEWDSIIPNLLAGNYDMIMAGMSITDERQETIDFSADYFPPDPSRFVGAAGIKLDFDNLTGVKIGVQGATIQAAYAESTFSADNSILSYETGDQSVADLMSGNIDVLLADGTFLEPVIEGSNGAVEFTGPEVIIGGGVAIGLRKDDAGLQQKMADAIAAAKADGTVDKLIMEFFKKGPFYGN
ncbi:MAG: transporter substrate-binding domain-containing protein [Granulosicoccus sp.]